MIRSLVRGVVAGAQAARHVGARGAVGKTLAPASISSVRRYASASEEQDVKVPIQLFSAPGKYATSLFKAAAKADSLVPVGKELQEVIDLSKSNQLFNDFLRDPSVPVRDRIAGIEDIAKMLKVSSLTANFLALVAENGRLRELSKIADCFCELLMAYRGEVKATITSPLELTPQEVTDLKCTLQARLKPGQTLLLSQKVDKSIIGGLVIELGDKMIDMSIRTRMNKLQALLTAPIEMEGASAEA